MLQPSSAHGATFSQTFNLENSASSSSLNLSNFTVAAQMRKHSEVPGLQLLPPPSLIMEER